LPVGIDLLKNKKAYPGKFESYDAVDAYFGIAAQLGFAYLMVLIAFLYRFIRFLGKFPPVVIRPFILFFLFMAFESVSIGSFQYRHYLLFFALSSVLYENPKWIQVKPANE